MKCFLLVLAVVVEVSFGAKLPPHLDRCERTQKECLVKAVQGVISLLDKAIPEIGLPTLEPLEVPSMSIGAGTGTVAVQQNYKNAKVHGLSTIVVNTVDFDFENKILHLAGTIEELKQTADYDLNGKVLLLPIIGTGPSTLTLEKLSATIEAPFTEIEKKGKKYLKFDGLKLNLRPNKVRFLFENLFNGDKALGDNINNVLNDNWKEVFEDVRNGYEEAYGLIIQQLTNDVFGRVPINEIFLNES